MNRRSKHFSSEERGVIVAEDNRGGSQRAIGARLRRPASTICGELARDRQKDGTYCPQSGWLVYDVRRTRCRRPRKPAMGGEMHRFVHDHLVHRRWSPEQISHRLRLMNQGNPSTRVSHETIYSAIYAQPRGGWKAAMVEAPRQAKAAHGRQHATLACTSMDAETLRTINRPEKTEARIIPGHWEGDLIKDAFSHPSVNTLVERKTRFVFLCKMNGNGADAVLGCVTRKMKRLPQPCARA